MPAPVTESSVRALLAARCARDGQTATARALGVSLTEINRAVHGGPLARKLLAGLGLRRKAVTYERIPVTEGAS